MLSAGCALEMLRQEPFETYRAKAKVHLSSHQLIDFRRCPLLYRRKKLGVVPDEDRPAYEIGRAAHALILEGEEVFEQAYAVGGPINPRTGRFFGPNTKAFSDWAEDQGRPVVTEDQYLLISKLALAVGQHEKAKTLLAEGVPERVVRNLYCGVPSQIRMDWFNPLYGIVDLKTCDDLTWFEADTKRYGYVHQLAFYRSVLANALGEVFPVHLIAVEKKEPFRCGVWKFHEDALEQARRENEAAIERLKQCGAADVWPTGYEDVRVFDSI